MSLIPQITEELFPTVDSVCDTLRTELKNAAPTDIYQFCATYFNKKLESQRSQLLTLAKVKPTRSVVSFQLPTRNLPEIASYTLTNTQSKFEPESSEESDLYVSGNESLSELDPDDSFLMSSSDDEDEPFVPPVFVNNRRKSVSAESLMPTSSGNFVKTVIAKTPEQRAQIQVSISNNLLFKNLDEEQYKDVIDAMTEKKVSLGEDVILQGGVGDYFYVVQNGHFDVYVTKEDEPETKVLSYGPGDSFGELALMYNAPRAATVRCTENATLWALDRVTFRRILMERTSLKRRMYESFLEEVPILANLKAYERNKIADALESIIYNTGEIVIQQGDNGQNFYLIESGEASVTKVDENGVEHQLPALKKGDYFGALLTDKPRKATVSARGRLKCATLGKKAFVRLLGPVVEIIKRNSENYVLNTTNDFN